MYLCIYALLSRIMRFFGIILLPQKLWLMNFFGQISSLGAATDKHGCVCEADKDMCHKNSQRRILSKCEPSLSMIGGWTNA